MKIRKTFKKLKTSMDYYEFSSYNVEWFNPWNEKAHWLLLGEELGEGWDCKITSKTFKNMLKEEKGDIKSWDL